MKKIYSILMASTVALATLSSCDKDVVKPDQPDQPTVEGSQLGITTASVETKAVVLEFSANATMNIYAKTYNRVDAPNLVDNVKATYDGAKWSLTPAVGITEAQKNAFVFAVAPYDAAHTDPKSIPVDLAKQYDLMYSGNYVPASFTSPNVKLTMKHALSLMTVNIVPVGYSGAGKLTELRIEGDIVNTTAKLDASTGKLTDAANANTTLSVKQDNVLQQGGWTNGLPGVWVIPYNTKIGTAVLTAVIDGQEFTATVPEVEMKQGWQYIFRLVLTNAGMEFDPSKTETLSLNVDTDQKQEFQKYGKIEITTSGTWLNAPDCIGNGVFGTITLPTGHATYAEGTKLDNLKSGDKVIVETWNSDGFSIATLDGIDVIDVSDYD